VPTNISQELAEKSTYTFILLLMAMSTRGSSLSNSQLTLKLKHEKAGWLRPKRNPELDKSLCRNITFEKVHIF